MVFGEQVQHWSKEGLKSFEEISKDINEVKKCNQQTKVLRNYLEEKRLKELKQQTISNTTILIVS